MTKEEAKHWFDGLTEEKIINLLIEHNDLKQALCARTLLIPTGADNWISRAIRRAEHLTECERQIRKVIFRGSELIEELKDKSSFRDCWNCFGTKVTREGSCVICQGTGLNKLIY